MRVGFTRPTGSSAADKLARFQPVPDGDIVTADNEYDASTDGHAEKVDAYIASFYK